MKKITDFNLCTGCGVPIQNSPDIQFCPPCKREYADYLKKNHLSTKPINIIHLSRKLFRKHNQQQNITDQRYTIRDIPHDLWQKIKINAATTNASLRTILLKSLYIYLAEGNPVKQQKGE